MMDHNEELFPAKSGFPTVRCNGIFLHSLYDPAKEAEQYLRSLSLPSQLKTVLVLGSSLGYLENCLHSLYPQAKVLSLQFSTFFKGKEVHSLPSSHCFYPDPSISVEDFLYERIEETDLLDLQIISWKPAFQAYPQIARTISERVLQVLREMGRSLETSYVFGRRWILNTIRNFLFHSPAYRLQTVHHPICIAASGPSLSLSLPYLRRFRNRFILLSLPSSLMTLWEHGIIPDLVVMTDAGNYATSLLYPLLRNSNMKKVSFPLAFPLTASFFPPHKSIEPILFSQGSGIERVFLSYLPFSLKYVPPNGTVAGTALELALNITTGPIVFVGLDLSVEGFLEHARPHPFERLFEVQTSRLSGTETPWICRILGQYPEKFAPNLRTSPALRTYAEWFRVHAHRWKNRIFRIYPSTVNTGMDEKPPSFLGTYPPVLAPILKPIRSSLSWEDRKRIVKKVLETRGQSLPTVDPSIARAFDLPKVDHESPLHPNIRLRVTLKRILDDPGGDL